MRSLRPDTKAALLIMEIQIGTCHVDHAMFKAIPLSVRDRGIIEKINSVADALRAKGLPIFHCRMAHIPDFRDTQPNTLIAAMSLKHRGMVEGSRDVEAMDGLVVGPNDIVSYRSSGLNHLVGTSVDMMMRRMGIETVIITGISTNIGVAGMTLTAAEFGYHVVVPEDCIAGSDISTHNTIVQHQLRMVSTISSSEEIIQALGTRTNTP